MAVPFKARNGRWIAGKSSGCRTPSVVVFPPEPPVAAMLLEERPGAVKGAFFAAKRTLYGEDRSERIPLEGMAATSPESL